MKLLQGLNRHDRTWNRSGRVTAVLPHNSYYVLFNGSRRVIQRTRAHIKPIALFPIRADNVCFARQPLGVTNDAVRPGPQPNVVPVPIAAQDHAIEEKTALEPAAQTKDADKDILEVKCPVDSPALVQRSASPCFRRR